MRQQELFLSQVCQRQYTRLLRPCQRSPFGFYIAVRILYRRSDSVLLRAHVFEWMARLAAAQADFYESQADYHNHLDRLENRLIDILDRLTPKNED